jgi:hypothetical protein
MLNTIAKRIQSRLSRQGLKISLGEIKEQCDRLIPDIENPTDQEILNVSEFFLSSATSLAVVDDVTTEQTAVEELETSEAALNTENETALATATKSELVANTAGELGIVLNTGEIELIAQNVNYSSDDLQESLEEIKSAIIAFVRHKIALNSQKIGETLEEITQVATDGFNQNSQQLTDGLQNINKQLQQQSTDFKSKVRSTLKCFQLPAAS